MEFLGYTLATPCDIKIEQTRNTSRAWSGKPSGSRRPDTRLHLVAGFETDHHGVKNLAGKIGAHLRRYGTDEPWEEEIPQHMNTLASNQVARVVRANTAIGANVLPASGTVSGVSEGRFITIGTDKRVYEVDEVQAGNNLLLDRGLEKAVARGATINFTPTINWVWDESSVDNPPIWVRGINVEFVADAWEHV